MGYKIESKKKVEFEVVQNGETIRVTHIFNAPTTAARIDYNRATVDVMARRIEGREDSWKLAQELLERRCELWKDHIIAVEGYSIAEDLLPDGWKEIIPLDHRDHAAQALLGEGSVKREEKNIEEGEDAPDPLAGTPPRASRPDTSAGQGGEKKPDPDQPAAASPRPEDSTSA